MRSRRAQPAQQACTRHRPRRQRACTARRAHTHQTPASRPAPPVPSAPTRPPLVPRRRACAHGALWARSPQHQAQRRAFPALPGPTPLAPPLQRTTGQRMLRQHRLQYPSYLAALMRGRRYAAHAAGWLCAAGRGYSPALSAPPMPPAANTLPIPPLYIQVHLAQIRWVEAVPLITTPGWGGASSGALHAPPARTILLPAPRRLRCASPVLQECTRLGARRLRARRALWEPMAPTPASPPARAAPPAPTPPLPEAPLQPPARLVLRVPQLRLPARLLAGCAPPAPTSLRPAAPAVFSAAAGATLPPRMRLPVPRARPALHHSQA